ncbi:hypothetical protein [Marseilla massiliensis]|uniref:Uncharacterized protein n=1 Tax=Marseilla massiliensis TaxID=1841864 RepID=A0A938WN13_9BACT|nr:hypothetical protein [Marseilla massiliensis]MBM6661987.1 hypothetical protein [Marseilla massiliensis]
MKIDDYTIHMLTNMQLKSGVRYADFQQGRHRMTKRPVLLCNMARFAGQNVPIGKPERPVLQRAEYETIKQGCYCCRL